MFGKLNQLRLRKQALILESELNRLALLGEWQNLREATTQFGGGSKTRSWLLSLAPVAGVMATRLFRGRRHERPSRLSSLVRCVHPLYSLWKSFRNGA
jgi:hypothetical protein